ncbi:thermonuclease family protein [Azospirillum griseum]|nr:thermonuclease family protein [Azospirillum griseum]
MRNSACSERPYAVRHRFGETVGAALLTLAVMMGGAGDALAQTAGKAAPNGKMPGMPNESIKGRATAPEGDLLVIDGTPIRLMGIDAPDPGQKCKNRYGHELDCFKVATAVLANMVKDEEVSCTIADKDRNGEKKGECRVRGVDLGMNMVAMGWAFHYAGLSMAYQRAETYAQSKKMGLWAGQVEKPWQWRSRMQREKGR